MKTMMKQEKSTVDDDRYPEYNYYDGDFTPPSQTEFTLAHALGRHATHFTFAITDKSDIKECCLLFNMVEHHQRRDYLRDAGRL